MLRPQWCCHCKVVILGSGVRKSARDLAFVNKVLGCPLPDPCVLGAALSHVQRSPLMGRSDTCSWKSRWRMSDVLVATAACSVGSREKHVFLNTVKYGEYLLVYFLCG